MVSQKVVHHFKVFKTLLNGILLFEKTFYLGWKVSALSMIESQKHLSDFGGNGNGKKCRNKKLKRTLKVFKL